MNSKCYFAGLAVIPSEVWLVWQPTEKCRAVWRTGLEPAVSKTPTSRAFGSSFVRAGDLPQALLPAHFLDGVPRRPRSGAKGRADDGEERSVFHAQSVVEVDRFQVEGGTGNLLVEKIGAVPASLRASPAVVVRRDRFR